mgnify:CR=1 FL=1
MIAGVGGDGHTHHGEQIARMNVDARPIRIVAFVVESGVGASFVVAFWMDQTIAIGATRSVLFVAVCEHMRDQDDDILYWIAKTLGLHRRTMNAGRTITNCCFVGAILDTDQLLLVWEELDGHSWNGLVPRETKNAIPGTRT